MKERSRTCRRLRHPGRWPLAALLSFFALALPGEVRAQPWSGGATLGVQLRGSGGPVVGAIVEIRLRRPGLTSGPEARSSDTRGQANFVGIADGRWSLEIKHPEYLSFVAVINVRRGKRPQIVTQFLEATGAGRGTLRVKFLRSDKPFGEAIPGTAVTERSPMERTTEAAPARPVSAPVPDVDRQAARGPEDRSRVDARAVPGAVVSPAPPPPAVPADEPHDEPATPAEPQEKPEEKEVTLTAETPTPLVTPTEAPAAAPVESPPVSAPEPMAEPPVAPPVAPEPPRPEETPTRSQPPRPAQPQEIPSVPVPEPISPPPPVETPEEVVPRPTQIQAEEAGETSPAPTPTEVEAPAPEAISPPAPAPLPAPARVPGSLRAYRDRSCFECKPGEWAVSTQLEVTGGQACRTTAEVAVRRAMRDVAAAGSELLGSFSGPLPLGLDDLPLAAVSAAARNTLIPYLEPSASCRFLAIVVPEGGNFMGFRFEAEDANSTGDCSREQECEIGDSRFLFSPGIARGIGASIVYSLFENTGSISRTARLTGFFLPPGGWSPDPARP